MYDYLIVGAGLAGCVLAERLANESKKKVLVMDRRSHLGGNCYDEYNRDGILIHKYGPHLFHTNNKNIVEYLSRFTDWHKYEHRVLSSVNGKLVPIPINRNTINELFGLKLKTDDEVVAFYNREKEIIKDITNSEDFLLAKIGKRLYSMLYYGYTKKQWGIEPSNLSASVCERIPVYTDDDCRYFQDTYQLIPLNGYTKMINNVISHPRIELALNTDFKSIAHNLFDKLIYTGPIDEYYEYFYGRLPYRSLYFKEKTYKVEWKQPVAIINYPNEKKYTRTTEYKHITGQNHPFTTIVAEYPTGEGEPYYPIPTKANIELFEKYQNKAKQERNIYFVGRMASYKYYNMDQVIAQSLNLFEKIAHEGK